jgi:hypothetical protein
MPSLWFVIAIMDPNWKSIEKKTLLLPSALLAI